MKIGVYNFTFEQIESLMEYLPSSTVKSIIYTSSTSVYPDINREVTEEDEVIENHALIKVENLLKSLPQNVTILRCGGFFFSTNTGYHVSGWDLHFHDSIDE